MKRNKIKILTILSAVMIFMSSCEKKVLDLEPYTSFSDASAFTDAAKVNLAINGVYDAAQSGFYAGGVIRGYPFGAASIQQGDMRGEDMANVAAFYQITYEATYNNSSPNNGFQFQTLYALINKANLVIEGVNEAVSKGIIPAATGNTYVAECRFLRALAHHELVINFARPYADGNGNKLGIIYRDFGINSEAKAEKARALKREDFPVSLVYTKILEDLDYAEINLPNAASIKTYRASKAAAIALKMRVKMHMADWPGVIAEGNKIISANAPFTSSIGGWKLTTAPDGPFASNTSDENIFSIRNDATDNPGVNGALANMLGDPAINGRGLVVVSPIIWSNNRWLCSDLRRASSLIRVPQNVVTGSISNDTLRLSAIVTGRLAVGQTLTGTGIAPGTTILSLISGSGVNAIYRVSVSQTVPAGTRITASEVVLYSNKYRDIAALGDAAPIIRYAEVLLMQAEAEARNDASVSARALALLNAVRNRAVTTPADQYTLAAFPNKNALIGDILLERRIEFIAEGKRWGDIHRLALDPNFAPFAGGGIPAKIGSGATNGTWFNCAGVASITRSVNSIPYSDFRFLWPIPLAEIQQNPNYTQNPGY